MEESSKNAAGCSKKHRVIMMLFAAGLATGSLFFSADLLNTWAKCSADSAFGDCPWDLPSLVHTCNNQAMEFQAKEFEPLDGLGIM